MLVLMKIPSEDMPDETALRDGSNNELDDAAEILFNTVKDQYNEQADCSDAYLHEYGDVSGLAENLGLVLGARDPDTIRDTAENWNKRVQKDFDNAVKTLARSLRPLPDGTYPWLDGSSTEIYALKKAAMALDGQFYDFADYALLVNQAQYFTTVLTSIELTDILRNPGQYAIIEVSPK